MAPKAASSGSAERRGSTTSPKRQGAKRKGRARPRASVAAASLEAGTADVSTALSSAEERIAAATLLQAMARSAIARRRVAEMRKARNPPASSWFSMFPEDAGSHQATQQELAEVLRDTHLRAMKAAMRKDEQDRERELEKWRKKKKLAQQAAKLMTAALDGEQDEVVAILGEGMNLDVRHHQTTALSEAACGGAAEVVRLLLRRRANPNVQGELGRSPLWRACYQGHAKVVSILLESGADPRIGNSENEVPIDIATSDDIIAVLRGWDTAHTDRLVQDFEAWYRDQRAKEEESHSSALKSFVSELEEAKVAYASCQQLVVHRKAALRRRILEHDVCVAQRKCDNDIAQMRMSCELAQANVASAQSEFASAKVRLDTAKVKHLRAAEEAGLELEEELVGRALNFHDLEDVLLRDIGGSIASAEKWPMLLDPSDCAVKFLQYSGNAVLNFWDAHAMEPDILRRALLSMIRSGGVLTLNLDLFGAGTSLADLAEPFDDIRPGLFKSLQSRSLLAPDPTGPEGSLAFHRLVDKEKDGSHFDVGGFPESNIEKFKFVVLTSTLLPHAELREHFDTMQVVVAARSSLLSQ
eukprot:TRINITY_DN109649_c0_g1_i1.p1 TRINITY_DN109649_c0_g1~~TRINITY_DN109649_c0_g1_i1.p1  ORF type:complete len:585 (-),score=121.44 TRINITY_DN109649_c0_g1_i1:24-1778(-)